MLVNLDYDEFITEEGDFAALLEESEREKSEGAIQTGEIVAIDNESVMVAIPGEKIEAKLRLSEIQDKDGNLLFKRGEKIEVFVSFGLGGRPIASYERVIKARRIVEKINQLGDDYQDKVIEAKVSRVNRGGFVLDYDGADVFMPRRDSAIREDDRVIGRVFKVAVISIDKERNSIIVSRKRFFDIDEKDAREKSVALLENGGVQKGVVKKIAPFGIFVDVGGIEGLVHYTELSHRGPINPAKNFKEGDEVSVKILSYDEKKRRFSLSMKALGGDPWKEIEKELEVGYAIKVSVSNIEPYGVFVDLGNEIEGFLHISEISWDKNIKHPSNYLSIGQEIDVEIIEIDTQNRRLRVSLKKLLDKPFTKFVKTHQVGEVLKGKVITVTDFGAFVSLGGVDGLLHNEDAFWDKSLKCKDEIKVGDELEVKIVKIDRENERISLSKKLLENSPAKKFAEKYRLDDVVHSSIIDIKDFGLFVKIDDTEALIRNEDLYPLKKEDLKVGDGIECVITYIDEENNKIRASVKRLERQKEKENLRAFNSDEKMTLGDKLKDRL